jgi:hypothetical protein
MKVSMLLMLLLCGCSSARVRCDAGLRPINVPAVVGTKLAAPMAGSGH